MTKKIDAEWLHMILAGKKKSELPLADFDIEDVNTLYLEGWVGKGVERKPARRFIGKKVTYARKVVLKNWI